MTSPQQARTRAQQAREDAAYYKQLMEASLEKAIEYDAQAEIEERIGEAA